MSDEIKTPIVLRPAAPDFQEGLAFARYADEVADGFFGVMLGSRAHEIVATAYAETGHDLSYQNVTFAERDSVIVGMTLAYSAEQHRQSSRKPLFQAAGWNKLRLVVVSTVFAPMMRIVDSMGDKDYYLQTIAVDEALRSEGVGTILMDAYEEDARAKGSTRLALDVFGENNRARQFYERRGWTIESQWPKRFKIPSLKFYRMTKDL